MPRAAIIAVAALLVLAASAANHCDDCTRFGPEKQAQIDQYLRESCLGRYDAVIAQLAARPYAHELPQVDEAEQRREFEALYDEDPRRANERVEWLQGVAAGRYDYLGYDYSNYFEEPIPYAPRYTLDAEDPLVGEPPAPSPTADANCARFVPEVQARIDEYLAHRPAPDEPAQAIDHYDDDRPWLLRRQAAELYSGADDYTKLTVLSAQILGIEFDGRPHIGSGAYDHPCTGPSTEAREQMAQRKAEASERQTRAADAVERLVRQNDNEWNSDRADDDGDGAPGPYTVHVFAYNEPGVYTEYAEPTPSTVSDTVIDDAPDSLGRMRLLRHSKQCGPAFVDFAESPSPMPRTDYGSYANASCIDHGCGCGKRVPFFASEPTHVPDNPILYERDEPPTNGRRPGFNPPLGGWANQYGAASEYFEEDLVFNTPAWRAALNVPCDPDVVFSGINFVHSGEPYPDWPLDLDDEEYEFDEPPVQSVQDFMAAAHGNRLTEEENAEIDAALQAVLDEQCGGGPADDDDPSPIACKYPDENGDPYECVPDPEGRRMRDFPVTLDFGCDADDYFVYLATVTAEPGDRYDVDTSALLYMIRYAVGGSMREDDPARQQPVVLRPRAPCPQHKLDAIRAAFPNATLVEPSTTTPAD